MSEDLLIRQFGPYQLDIGTHTLIDGNEPIELEPLPFDVLVTLVENAPNLVSRKVLFEKHWAGLQVTDNVLDQAIATLRRVFRKHPEGGRFLQTVTKRGFRFTLAVHRVAAIAPAKQAVSPKYARPADETGEGLKKSDARDLEDGTAGEPKGKRSQLESEIELTKYDVELIQIVHEYRLVQVEHLEKLTGRSKEMLNASLLALIEQRYLERRGMPEQEHVFVVGKAGWPLLAEHGIKSKEARNRRRLLHKEMDESALRHQLMITDTRIALALACRTGNIRLVNWRIAEEIQDHVPVWQAGIRERLPLRADVFFTLEDGERLVGRNRVHFFLDVDYPSLSDEQFQKKALAYWHYQNTGKYSERYGLRSFRVVTFTFTNERAEYLTQLTLDTIPDAARRHFLFSALPTASENILGDVFLRPLDMGAGTRHRLVPPTATAAQYLSENQ
jgi:DNA-binding winged helix-turn-helix (wHTH) protein